MNDYYYPTLWYGESVRALQDNQSIKQGCRYHVYDLNDNGKVRVSFYDYRQFELYHLPEWYAPHNFRLDF